MNEFWQRMQAFLFDLDGCLYYGTRAAPGAQALLERLEREKKLIFFVTNNSTDSSTDIAHKLNGLGLPAKSEQIITAGETTARYVREIYGHASVKVAGSESLCEAMKRSGLTVLDDHSTSTADVVVIGRDVQFHYDKLQWIAAEAQKGAVLIGTNIDSFHLGTRHERVPETGALLAAVESVTGTKIHHIGKPQRYMFEYILKLTKLSPKDCVMIGDNPDTDIVGGVRSGMKTIWICGEENKFIPSEVAKKVTPDLTIQSVEELLQMYLE